MGEPLSKEVFEAWRAGHDQFMQDMRDTMKTQAAVNLDLYRKVSSLETYRQTDAAKLGIFAAIVSAAAGAITSVISVVWRH